MKYKAGEIKKRTGAGYARLSEMVRIDGLRREKVGGYFMYAVDDVLEAMERRRERIARRRAYKFQSKRRPKREISEIVADIRADERVQPKQTIWTSGDGSILARLGRI